MKRRLTRFPFWQRQRQLALLLFVQLSACWWWNSQGVVCQSPNRRKEVWPAHNFTKKICISFVLVGLVLDYRSSCGTLTGLFSVSLRQRIKHKELKACRIGIVQVCFLFVLCLLNCSADGGGMSIGQYTSLCARKSARPIFLQITFKQIFVMV